MNHGIRMMISKIAFDRPNRLRMFLYHRFKFYTVIPIVQIELSSVLGNDRTSFEMTGAIGTIIWKPGLSARLLYKVSP